MISCTYSEPILPHEMIVTGDSNHSLAPAWCITTSMDLQRLEVSAVLLRNSTERS
jgi:hypothetical protein